MLLELSVMEQRYQAVLAVVKDGWKVAEVARRVGVSRQAVHAWIARYQAGGLAEPLSPGARQHTLGRAEQEVREPSRHRCAVPPPAGAA